MVFAHKKSVKLNKLAENPFKKYQSTSTRLLKYGLMTIGGVGFILLLILPNVDFTGNCYSDKKLDTDESTTSTTTNQGLYDNAIIVFPENASCHLNANVSRCTFHMQNCTVHCIGHNVTTVYILDECKDGIKLIVESANLTNAQWNSTVFAQHQTVRELSIQQSNLSHSLNNFFQNEHFNQLENLTLANNYMQQLEATTFSGLPQLKQLNLSATDTVSNCSFLKPLHASLHRLQLRLSTSQEKQQVCPETWFSYNTLYPMLEFVNLSGNNFQDSINSQSFSMLIAVKQLILSGCNISYLPSDTFQGIDEHLETLDLSGNLLTKTTGLEDAYFSQQLTVNLQQNLWDCNCKNLQLFHTFHRKDITLEKMVFCTTPTSYKNLLVTEVVDICAIFTDAALAEHGLALTGKSVALQLYCSLPWSINNIKGPVMLQEISRFLLEQTKPGSVNITIYFNSVDSTLYYYSRPSNGADDKFTKNRPMYETAALALISTMNKSIDKVETPPMLHTVKKVKVDRIHVEVSGLLENTNYLFCIVPSDTQHSSPFNCQSWTERAVYEVTSTVWINNDTKPWVVLTVCFTLTVCFSFSFGLVIMQHVRKNAKQKQQNIEHNSVERPISLTSSADLELDLSAKTENTVEEFCVEKSKDDITKYVKTAPDGSISFGVYESISGTDASHMKVVHNNSLYEEYYEELF